MILVINAGSSSIKAAVFDDGAEAVRHEVDGIGTVDGPSDHHAAFETMLSGLRDKGFALADLHAAGHRVVHGGEDLIRPARITQDVHDRIEACVPLAPLHNPHNLAAIDALARLAPDLPQVACFDTAFHATMPERARRYALPDRPETRAIRRYGFHGLSYAAMVRTWRDVTGTGLPRRLLALHLGNGASACAILDGRSVDSTMGYSPVEGLTMGTRVGRIDANAVLDLAGTLGIKATRTLLNRESGLRGLSGLTSDMRRLEAADTPETRFAIEFFCYTAAREVAGLIPALGGVDAIAFTGGIGENSRAVRHAITGHLSWLGEPAVHVIPAAEEAQIARDTEACLEFA